MTRHRTAMGLAGALAMVVAPVGADDQPAAGGSPGPGPVLLGRLVDEQGRPVTGAKVILYAGFATRWKVDEAVTGDDGRYRFDSVRSSMIRDEAEGRWDHYVGVRVEHPTHVEADGRSWRDLRIPGVAGHEETLDLRLAAAGHLEGTLKAVGTGEPLGNLDLRILQAAGDGVSRGQFRVYAETDGRGRFRSPGLFPGEYEIEVNSSTLDYPRIGRARVEAGRTTEVDLDAVALPEVVAGRVVDAAGDPIGEVELTLLAPEDSDFEPAGPRDLKKVRSRAWTIFRPSHQDRFELAFLPGLEGSRFVLASHRELGWAKVTTEGLRRGEPIRLRPWGPE